MRNNRIIYKYLLYLILVVICGCTNGSVVKFEPVREIYIKDSSVVLVDTIYNIKFDADTLYLPYDLSVLKDSRAGLFSVMFYDLDNDSVIFSFNENKNVLPASVLKLITSAASIKILGNSYRFKTEYFYEGTINKEEKILNGNIIITGNGDPTIGKGYFEDSSLVKFDSLAKYIKNELGVENITGRIKIINENSHEKWYGKGWDIDDISFYYSPVISPISFNENLVKLSVKKGKVYTEPYYPFDVKLDTTSAYRSRFSRIMGTDSVVVSSRFNKRVSGYITVNNPEKLFTIQLAKVFKKNGIAVQDKNVAASDTVTKIKDIFSEELITILAECNKKSNNFYAEQLFRENVRMFSYDSLVYDSIPVNEGLTKKSILKVSRAMYNSLFGITDAKIADGSGLSRQNFFSAYDFIKVLKTMYEDENFYLYLSSLSQPGNEGTLEYKFVNNKLAGALFAKTGSMTGVNNISGYMLTKNNKRIAFCILNNYYKYYRGTMNNRLKEILIYFIENY